jgi:hypothetical protein
MKKGPHCHQCGSTGLRRSHFRPDDVFEIVQLNWPVRCRSCMERQFVSIFYLGQLSRN